MCVCVCDVRVYLYDVYVCVCVCVCVRNYMPARRHTCSHSSARAVGSSELFELILCKGYNIMCNVSCMETEKACR